MQQRALTVAACIAVVACAGPGPVVVRDAGVSAGTPIDLTSPPDTAAAPTGSPQWLKKRGPPVPPDPLVLRCTSQTYVDGWSGLRACLAGTSSEPYDAGHKLGAVRPPPINQAWTVPEWDIDPVSGLNTNTCVDSAHACKTWAEVMARLTTNAPHLRQDTGFFFRSSQPDNTDPVTFNPYIENGANISIQGVLGAALASGTMAGVVSKNRGAGQLLNATLAGGLAAGEMIVNATHSSVAWLYKNVSGNTWSISQPLVPMTVPVTTTAPSEVDTWANGDSYSIYLPSSVAITSLSPILEGYSASLNNGLIAYHLVVSAPNSLLGADPITLGGSGDSIFCESSFRRLMTIAINSTVGISAVNNDYAQQTSSQTVTGGAFIIGGQMRAGFHTHVGNASEFNGDLIVGGMGAYLSHQYGYVYIDSSLEFNGLSKGSAHIGTYGGDALWGPGQIRVGASTATLTYPGAAVSTFLNTGGITIEGQTVASAYDTSVTPGTWHPGIAITAANLDLSIASGGFGGTAIGHAGCRITNNAADTASPANYCASVPNCGTGQASGTAHAVALWEGTSPMGAAAPGTISQVLTSNGTGVDPSFQPVAASAVASVTGTSGVSCSPTTGAVSCSNTGATSVTGAGSTSCSPTTGAVTCTTANNVSNGLTGDTTLTAHGVMIGEGTSPVAAVNPLGVTTGHVLRSVSGPGDPVWSSFIVANPSATIGTVMVSDGNNWVNGGPLAPVSAWGSASLNVANDNVAHSILHLNSSAAAGTIFQIQANFDFSSTDGAPDNILYGIGIGASCCAVSNNVTLPGTLGTAYAAGSIGFRYTTGGGAITIDAMALNNSGAALFAVADISYITVQ